MRLGELASLKWANVDLERNLITVGSTMTKSGIQHHTKSKKTRKVPLNSISKLVLLQHRNNSKDHNNVFSTPNGNAIPVDHFSNRHFKKMLKEANLQDRPLNFHSLRHTFASWYLIEGGDIFILQKILGHSNMNTTQIYAHLSPKYLTGKTDHLNFEDLNNLIVITNFSDERMTKANGVSKVFMMS